MNILRCLLLLSCLRLVMGGPPDPGSHSLRYFFSFLSEPLPGVPQNSVVGYVDDVPIIGYTSESKRAGSQAPWMERITDEQPQYWEEITETFEHMKKKLSDSLKSLMEEKNQSTGLHVFQVMLGCERHKDGSVKWFERSAYDGSNYTAAVTEDQGNSEELIGCKKDLNKLLKYGEESLQRRVTPRTMVSQRKSGNQTFLIGYAYGFYPREIEVKWFQNGVEKPGASRELLPNPDGTYQVRTTVQVQEGDDVKTYEYHVNHSSLLEIVIVTVGYDPGLHSLRYFFSFLSEPLPGVPQYSVIAYVDDVPIIGYTSESRRAGPRSSWMENITDEEPQYWEESTETFEHVKKKLSNSLRSLMEEKNQSTGLHVFQVMLGCERHEDGHVKWFERSAYDGSNYTATFSEDQENSEELKECIKDLNKLLKYGEGSLQRRVTPRTMVSQRKSGSHTFLIGYAYGFYPREIEVKWFQNVVEKPGASRELLPNPDGTYQVRTTVEVQEGDDVKTYEYHVNHSRLREIVIVTVGHGTYQ